MNKKGFTLTELLAVLVILAVIMTAGSASIAGIRNRLNKNMFEKKMDLVVGAAKSWGADNIETVNAGGASGVSRTVGFLIGTGTLETEDQVPITKYAACETENRVGSDCIVVLNPFDKSVVNGLQIKIYEQHNRVYACIYKNSNNKSILNENSSWTEYNGESYYCS